jgi:hypothetical protein
VDLVKIPKQSNQPVLECSPGEILLRRAKWFASFRQFSPVFAKHTVFVAEARQGSPGELGRPELYFFGV